MARPRDNHFAALLAAALSAVTLAGCTAASDRGVISPSIRGAAPAETEAVRENAVLRAQIDQALASVELDSFDPLPEDAPFDVLSFDALAGWAEDDHGAALIAFQRSCARLKDLKRTSVLGAYAGRIDDWRPSCDAAATVNGDAARAFFELAFTPVRIRGDGSSKITAYYEPVIEARLQPSGRFQHPIYAKPPELGFRSGRYGVLRDGRVAPFATRGEIQRGALDGRGLEIAYLADPVEVFFLHIQGSGQLRFGDGRTVRVGFAAKNGHPYRSAAQEMIRRGHATASTASQARISAFVAANPREGLDVLAANPSYIFFRELSGLDPNAGPVGALGVQLTAGRSIAVDRRYAPFAAPVWLESPGPDGPIRRLVIAQDTGSAIKGAQRADYFWGTGAKAGEKAGKVNHPGAITVLLPNATLQRLRASLS
ncbi:MAG: MltA domain-containing protein [Pseudomonadota bacterium]